MHRSTCAFKVVMAHHPLYTCGKKHEVIARNLREREYTYEDRSGSHAATGFAYEDVLVEGGVTLYLSGHEHVLQSHAARGVRHVVCGTASELPMFYGGENTDVRIDWVDRTKSNGFAVVELVEDDVDRGDYLRVRIISGMGTELAAFDCPESGAAAKEKEREE